MLLRDRRVAHRRNAHRLKRALEGGELDLHYQPIHDLQSGRVTSCEALLRWRDPSSRPAPIEQITSDVERGAELFDLATWATRKAFCDVMSWPSTEPPVRVGLNVSSRQLQERDLVAFVKERLAEHDVDPRRVTLEITEKSFIRRPSEMSDTLATIREMGMELWLDDFGTGHSSIEHLRYFPVDGLKIPGNYIRDVRVNERSAAIVRGMIDLAHALSIKTIAEGVEDRETLSLIEAMGCDRVQGFVFSKPLSCRGVVEYLAAQHS